MPSSPLRHAFTAHPASVGESYLQHLGVAMKYAGWLSAAAACAFIHALLPFLFEKTAGQMIRKMVADMDRRQASHQAPHPSMQAAE